MLKWTLEKKELELKFQWKISRGASTTKTIHYVKVSDGENFAFGEVAGITTQEKTSDSLLKIFDQFTNSPLPLKDRTESLKLPSHLCFGINSALTHLEAQQKKQTVEEFLKTRPTPSIPTSFSLPILTAKEIPIFFDKWNLGRFPVLKIKVGHESQTQACLALRQCYKGPIRIDANEAFENTDEVLRFIDSLDDLPVQLIEQPLSREKKLEYKKLKKTSPLPIFADESMQNQDIPDEFAELFHGVNIKMMKAGSYEQALKQSQKAKSMGLKTMLGCMVETSLGIRSALHIAQEIDYFDLDGFLFFKEDPFDFVTENNGILTYSSLL